MQAARIFISIRIALAASSCILSAAIASSAQTLTTIASFNGANGDTPYAMVVAHRDRVFPTQSPMAGAQAGSDGVRYKPEFSS